MTKRAKGSHDVYGEKEGKSGGHNLSVAKRKQKSARRQAAERCYGEVNRRLQKTIIDKNMAQRSLLFKAW